MQGQNAVPKAGDTEPGKSDNRCDRHDRRMYRWIGVESHRRRQGIANWGLLFRTEFSMDDRLTA